MSQSAQFADVQRVLSLFIQGIAGRPLHLKPVSELPPDARSRSITTDGASIHLPEKIDQFASLRENRGAFRFAALHQLGYLMYGTFAFSLERLAARRPDLWASPALSSGQNALRAPVSPPYLSEIERFFATARRPALLRRLFVALEDLRIDERIKTQFPGATADVLRVLTAARAERPDIRSLRPLAALLEGVTLCSLGASPDAIARLRSDLPITQCLAPLEALRSSGASVHDSALLALQLAETIEAWMVRPPPLTTAATPSDDRDSVSDGPAPESAALLPLPAVPDNISEVELSDEALAGPGVTFRGDLMPNLLHRLKQNNLWSSSPVDLDWIDIELGAAGDSDDGDPASEEPPRSPADATAFPGQSIRRQSGGRIDGPRSFLYEEWNYLEQRYLPAWCRVIETRVVGTDHEYRQRVSRDHAALMRRVRQGFASIRPSSWLRVHRTADGDELELSSLIDAVIDRRMGAGSDEFLYQRRDRGQREVAAAFLVDLSASTDFPARDPQDEARRAEEEKRYAEALQAEQSRRANTGEYGPYLYGGYDDLPQRDESAPKRRVIDVARDAMAVLCDGLGRLGDPHAIYGFSGDGRHQVDFLVAKDFNDAVSGNTWAALAAMQPRRSTRMGPAIRHAAWHLARQPGRVKTLMVVSDGYPQDSDYGPDRNNDDYGVQDTARALREAERQGITTFCITIDPAGHDYLRRMCKEDRYLVIDDVNDLPEQLSKVYRQLTTRETQ